MSPPSVSNKDGRTRMTTHEDVNQRYSQLQTLLRDHFGAEGRGIVEMVRSVETKLSTTLSWELRAIAHIRNKVVHEGLTEIPRYFEPLCKEALAAMKKQKPKRAAAVKKPVRGAGVGTQGRKESSNQGSTSLALESRPGLVASTSSTKSKKRPAKTAKKAKRARR